MFPRLGLGLGLRKTYMRQLLAEAPAIDWLEVISENFMTTPSGWGDPALAALERLRERYPLALHGVSLSLGSADPLDTAHLQRLKTLITRFEPAIVSDHLCWTSVDGEQLHDLLPLPLTESVLDYVCERVQRVQDVLGRRILVENVSSYVQYAESTLSEWAFLSALSERADCGLLLDVNNVYVNAVNHGFDPLDYLDGLPPARVGQMHLAGHRRQGDWLIDTHDQPVCEPVWALYAEAVKRFGPVSTNLERDGDYPELDVLLAELARARQIQTGPEHVCAA